MSFRILSLLIMSAVLIFFLLREEWRGGLDDADRVYLDWLVANSSEKIREPEIAFVRLDDEEERVFESWPLSALDYAVILKNLERFRPDVIMVVPTLAWSVDDEISQGALRTQLLRVPQALLGCILEDNPVQPGATPGAALPDPLVGVTAIEGDPSAIPAFTGVLLLPEKPFIPGSEIGYTHIDLGPASSSRTLKVPLLARRGDTVLPSFILKALLIQNDREESDLRVRLGDAVEIAGTDVTIPIDASGYLRVFAGIRERIPTLNASTLFLPPEDNADVSEIDLQEAEDPELASLGENIVLIGEDHTGAQIVPFAKGERVSRAELLALAIATIQSNRYIGEIPREQQYAVWGGLILIGTLMLRLPRGRIFGLSLLLLVVYLVASLLTFQAKLIWMSPVVPLALIAAIGVWGLILPAYRPGKATEEEEEEAVEEG